MGVMERQSAMDFIRANPLMVDRELAEALGVSEEWVRRMRHSLRLATSQGDKDPGAFIDQVVYFIVDGNGSVKIGISNDPIARLRVLQVGTTTPLQLLGWVPGGREKEVELHGRFNELRIRGEWFRLEGELESWVAENFKTA